MDLITAAAMETVKDIGEPRVLNEGERDDDGGQNADTDVIAMKVFTRMMKAIIMVMVMMTITLVTGIIR